MLTAVLTFLKSKVALYIGAGLVIILFIGGLWLRGSYYQGKYDKLIAKHNEEKVKIYEAFRQEADLHSKRLDEIQKVSTDTNKKIKELKLANEKCQSDDYYRMANSIIDRLH